MCAEIARIVERLDTSRKRPAGFARKAKILIVRGGRRREEVSNTANIKFKRYR